jgi:cyanophycin synthetase
VWGSYTAIQVEVRCTEEELALEKMPGFEKRLRERFPKMGSLKPGAGMPAALELAALGLQAHAGSPVTFSRSMPTAEPGVFHVVVEYREEPVGRLAIDLGMALCAAARENAPFNLKASLNRLQILDEGVRLGPSTGSIVAAAVARGIPFRRLTEGSLVQFGWGSKQRRIQAAEMDSTSVIGESIAQDKELTKFFLDAAAVPVPKGRPVKDAEDAWAAACEIGGQVVIKPRDGNQGKGVTANIGGRERVMAAYAAARAISEDVLVEQFLSGSDYRLLVINGRLIAAARRDPPLVIGDGVQTIRELVKEINADPRRSTGHATSLTKIRLDRIATGTLAKQGMNANSIPDKGVRVILRNNANLSTGGSATDVTDEVHRDLAARAVDAARVIGLDLCGVDVVCESVMKPLEAQSGGVIEVNAAPGLRMHIDPSFGKGRPVGEAIIASIFDEHEDGRIPVVAVTGTNGKTTVVRLVAHLLTLAGKRTGMTNSDGVFVSGKAIDTGDCSGPISARNVLFHPEVDAAVFETARGGILREGLGFDECDVAIVTNIGTGDHLGLNHVHTLEELAAVKRVIVGRVRAKGVAVLNAADPIVAAMAFVCPGSVAFFALDRHQRLLANHVAQGNRGVFVEDGHLVAAMGENSERIPLAEIPLTRDGTILFQIENILAATAAAWSLDIPWDIIRRGLATFVADAQNTPGRFNVFMHRGATVIADYGHNPDAIRALVQAIDAMPAVRRCIVISGAGDRRDCDIRTQTEILGEAFDDVILYQDMCQRGRADGEVLALLREGLASANRTTHCEEVHGEFLAIDTALTRLNSGDLCLILIDQIEEALRHIAERINEG